MKVVDSSEVQWHRGPGHRDRGILLRDLLMGEPGPDNFWFALVKVEDHYDAPPHRHNFEQVRFMLEGAFDFGPQEQTAGTIGYFCEGTTYTQTARGPSLTLLLQCEGPSYSRYMGISELGRSVQELRAAGGVFEGGRHRGRDGRDKDGYEAAWENLTGHPLTYPEPRFSAPVIMRTEAFSKNSLSDQNGVSSCFLGAFSERRLELRLVDLAPGARWTSVDERRTLIYVLSGAGEIEGRRIGSGFSLQFEPEEPWLFVAGKSEMKVYVIHLPTQIANCSLPL